MPRGGRRRADPRALHAGGVRPRLRLEDGAQPLPGREQLAKAVTRATRRALGSEDEATRMEALLSLTGVGVPTASTLLYFAFPDAYPILDVRALESLGVTARSQYPVSFWLAYLSACRRLAAECGVDIRTLDKALWQYSKERAAARARVAAPRR